MKTKDVIVAKAPVDYQERACPICHATKTTPSKVFFHVSVRHGACAICHNFFPSIGGLNSHYLDHHNLLTTTTSNVNVTDNYMDLIESSSDSSDCESNTAECQPNIKADDFPLESNPQTQADGQEDRHEDNGDAEADDGDDCVSEIGDLDFTLPKNDLLDLFGNNNVSRVCATCGDTFTLDNCFARKVNINALVLKRQCLQCDKLFTKGGPLEFHVENVQLKNVAMPKPTKPTKLKRDRKGDRVERWCSICHKMFKTQISCKTHIRDVHKKRDETLGQNQIGWQCHRCQQSFSCKLGLYNHVARFHENPGNMRCEICNLGFQLRGSWRKHMEAEHGHGRPEKKQCRICEKILGSSKALQSHVLHVHQNVGKLKCDQCPDKWFGTQERLDRHFRIRHDKTPHYPCTICDKRFRRRAERNVHVRVIHEGRRDYKCDQCEQSFTRSSGLWSHRKVVHDKDSLIFACHKCPRKFHIRSRYMRHMKRHNAKWEFQCDKCPRSFLTQDDLTKHVRHIHDGLYDIRCEECGKGFSSAPGLKRHILEVHRRQFQAKCEECGKILMSQNSLRKHMENIHNQDKGGIQEHVCQFCGKSLSTVLSLEKHIEKVHEKNDNEARNGMPAKHFQCPECGKLLSSESSLSIHIRSIHEERKLKCDKCPKQYSDRQKLAAHIRFEHDKIIRYQCDICQKGFACKDGLNRL